MSKHRYLHSSCCHLLFSFGEGKNANSFMLPLAGWQQHPRGQCWQGRAIYQSPPDLIQSSARENLMAPGTVTCQLRTSADPPMLFRGAEFFPFARRINLVWIWVTQGCLQHHFIPLQPHLVFNLVGGKPTLLGELKGTEVPVLLLTWPYLWQHKGMHIKCGLQGSV